MSGQFTPGPWRIEERLGGNRHLMVRAGFGNVCHVNAGINKEANAHLIAAAPDLYEALERFTQSCDTDETREAFNYAVKILAKARGAA